MVKPKTKRDAPPLHVRCTAEERELYAAAAEAEGLAEAQWVRQTLNRAARKVVS